MIATAPSSAEEFFSRRVADAGVLLEAARAHAAEGDIVSAMASALASDIATMQAVLWERINISPRSPQRQFFQAAEALTGAVASLAVDGEAAPASVADVISAERARVLSAVDDALAAEVAARWPDVDFLSAFPSPEGEDMAHSLSQRLEGMSLQAFVHERREAAERTMLEGQSARVRGATAEAIALAYEADFLALEAYLAESAALAGDPWLLTAIARWDLVVHAVGELAGLPEGFGDAVLTVRRAMTAALGDADGTRLDLVFVPA
ncbi:MAG: hypothetical protein Q7V58_08325 [Actinomycetota bacterium]|nr:hypothetical protein [Actinomycetota bacterium]